MVMEPVQFARLPRWADTQAASFDEETLQKASDALKEARQRHREHRVRLRDLKAAFTTVDGATEVVDASYWPTPESRFPFREDVNKRIVLWRGDITSLAIEAIVNPTDSRMRNKLGVSGRILDRAGPSLTEFYANQEATRTGCAGIAPGFDLHASHVIHTVGPRWSEKYATAAQNALKSCMRSVLELCVEKRIHDVAIPVLHTEDRGYPFSAAVHVVCRALRRFLEQHGRKLGRVVLCVDASRDERVYKQILPLYFPRSAAEELCANLSLPEHTGDCSGELVMFSRKTVGHSVSTAMTDDSLAGMSENSETNKAAALDHMRSLARKRKMGAALITPAEPPVHTVQHATRSSQYAASDIDQPPCLIM
ncbi:MAG: hypothetical protein MHM6MM_004297 [Cercozoa sp. M6MM]